MNNKELTFPVKKSDGTTVRMTMEELDNMKKGTSEEENVVKNEIKPEVIESDSAEATSDKDEILTEVGKEAPVLELEKTQDDGGDLSLSDVDRSIRDLAKTRKEEELKKKINFNEVQIEDLNTLSKPEALPITEIPVASQPKEDKEEKDTKWEKEDNKSLLDEPLDKSLPVPVEEGDTAITEVGVPKFDFPEDLKHEEVVVSKDKSSDLTGGVLKDKITDKKAKIPEFKKPAEPLPRIGMVETEKPLIQDVKMPEEIQIVGPVGELAKFSLTDFRRLGSNLDSAVKSLKSKFDNLSKDSYLEFMKGKEAWYNSPIYLQYQDTISKALAKNTKISEIKSDDKNSMNFEELKAVLSVNDYLD